MKKVLALVLVSSLLLIPFAVFADDAGVVATSLTIAKTINLDLSAVWPTITIDQPWIDDLFSGTLDGLINIWDERYHAVNDPEITVTIQSLGQFHVYGSYWTSLNTKVATPNTFIALDDNGTGGLGFATNVYLLLGEVAGLSSPHSTTPPDNTGDFGPYVLASFSDLNWTGGNNLDTAGDTNYYNVKWVPTELQAGDFQAGEVLDLRIYFVVDDPTI